MLKISTSQLDLLEAEYPGLKDLVLEIENSELPSCPHCNSSDSARILVGFTGRTTAIVAATTKVKLLPNRTDNSTHYCNSCNTFFKVTSETT